MSDHDFAIVGAGAAGLAAAKEFTKAGKSFVVLEAMDRIGGRAWSESDTFGIPFDQGCAWLHAADRNPFYPEAIAAGWTLYHHDMGLERVYFGRDTATKAQMQEMEEADSAFSELLMVYRSDSDRASELMIENRIGHATTTFAGPMDFAQDIDEISIADFAKAADLDPNYFTKEGFGALVHRWGADVPVSLSTPVSEIRWGGPGVELVTTRGTVSVGKVLVTASTGVLVNRMLRFAPNLPWDHEAAIEDLPMGLLTKIPLAISRDALGKNAFDDVLVESRSNRDIFFLCYPFDLDLVVGFIGGDFAWEIECAGVEAGVHFATEILVGIFGSNIRDAISKGSMTRWGSETWTRGAYAAARPGFAGARDVLSKPVGDRIWFAGEALAGPLMQTCGGARLSGEAVARRMLAA
ncbi:MAG: FAD-dependent oxidoreductase [Salaquimonas sp.]|nr:FAD-dependent oxidoreductase [Salaquimonas sp.]